MLQSLWDLAVMFEDHGYLAVGYHREVYLDHDPDDAGRVVTELQVGVTLTAGRGACPAPPAAAGRCSGQRQAAGLPHLREEAVGGSRGWC